jgi:hypothetical protein
MAGMVAVMVPWMTRDPQAMEPTSPRFWFTMSIALTAGFLVAYPINWWLVDRGLKHGMMTVRPQGQPVPHAAGLALAGQALQLGPALQPTMAGMSQGAGHVMQKRVSAGELARMTAITFSVLAIGIAIAGLVGDLGMRPGQIQM